MAEPSKDKDRQDRPQADPDLSVGAMGTASGQPAAETGAEAQSPVDAPVQTRPAAQVNEDEQPDTIWVVGATTDGKVAIWERDAAHPKSEAYPEGGEIMVSGDGIPHEVGDTAAVRVAIQSGRLKRVKAAQGKRMLDDHIQARSERRRGALQALREQAETAQLESQAVSPMGKRA